MSMKIENNKIVVLNPSTLDEVGEVDITDVEKVHVCIESSKKYKDWSSLSLKDRCKAITKFRKAIVANADLIQSTLKKETGKKDFDVFVEYFTVLEHLKQMPSIAKKSLKREYRNSGLMKNKKSFVVYEPLGTAGIISPWNYPFATPIISSLEALIVGNNVVLKPSEHTPLTPKVVKEIWDKHIGYKDAFQIINGCGDIGKELVESKNIDVVCFTGSTKVGKIIAQQCAQTLKPVLLELGGKDPMIVLKDSNLDRAVESAAFGGLSNAGQTCISVEEIFVENEISEEFIKKISKKIKSISSGSAKSNDLGPMIVSENMEKVEAHLKQVEGSCNIIRGINNEDSRYIAPTLVIEPPENSRIVNEETFGPVITVRSFDDEKHLLSMIHKTGYGLSASIFGKNKKRITQISSSIKTGNVSINDVLTHYGIASLPFGGEGLSGMGRSHGPEGLKALCRIKSIVVNKFNFINEPWWFGRPASIEEILKKVINLLYR